jgi:hypothetical protein
MLASGGFFIFLLILVVICWVFIQTLEEFWRLGSPNKYAISGFWRNLWEYRRKNFWYITECMRQIIDIILFIICGDYLVLTCMFCRCRLLWCPVFIHGLWWCIGADLLFSSVFLAWWCVRTGTSCVYYIGTVVYYGCLALHFFVQYHTANHFTVYFLSLAALCTCIYTFFSVEWVHTVISCVRWCYVPWKMSHGGM